MVCVSMPEPGETWEERILDEGAYCEPPQTFTIATSGTFILTPARLTPAWIQFIRHNAYVTADDTSSVTIASTTLRNTP